MSQIALYIVIYKFIYNYIEAGKAVFIFLNDLMTNDLNDHILRFSCFVTSMQTAIIQGVMNCFNRPIANSPEGMPKANFVSKDRLYDAVFDSHKP